MQQLGKIINPHDLRGARLKRNTLTAGIVAAYNPNIFPGGGTLYDRAGVNNGTITGATWAADARMGYVLNLGTTANQYYVNCGASVADFVDQADFTLSAWLLPILPTGYSTIIGKGDYRIAGYYVYIHTDGKCRITINELGSNQTLYQTTNFAFDGLWHHLACVRSAGVGYMYLDGRLNGSGALNLNIDTAAAYDLLIGHHGSGYYAGSMGEVCIFNRALSAAEIGLLYADPIGSIWDVGEEDWGWAPAETPAAGNPHYYYQMLSKRRAG